ncbi:MAG TPA: alpha/beta hydrolase-fold protein [Flavisolibacter sp.]|nr:alpha/beta hydrolase-fold protein [Flavisolibacter sp.]
MKYLFIILLLLSSFWLKAQLPKPASGTIVRHASFPSVYVQSRHIDVWLPENYSSSRKYAVLYMQDGQMLFDSSITWNRQEWGVDETLSRLMKEGKIRDCIVVGIWNTGRTRHAEYFPQKAIQWLPEADKNTIMPLLLDTPRADLYLKFLVTELKPWIDSAYATYTGPGHTFIAGSSMGALISLYALISYPRVFSGAACLSTHWPGGFRANEAIPMAFNRLIREELPRSGEHRLYFDYGTATLDSLYKPYQQEIDIAVKDRGYTDKNWITKEFPGEDHSEKAWSKRLFIPLEFLLRK